MEGKVRFAFIWGGIFGEQVNDSKFLWQISFKVCIIITIIMYPPVLFKYMQQKFAE